MNDRELRRHLTELLEGGHAHINIRDAVKGFPIRKAGIRPAGAPHSAWELLEHIRIAAEDIIRFSGVTEKGPRPDGSREAPGDYVELNWPDDYWPKSPAPANDAEWKRSVAAIEKGVAEFVRFIQDPNRDLFKPFPWGSGQTLLREALLLADHAAYHLGQLRLVREMVEEG